MSNAKARELIARISMMKGIATTASVDQKSMDILSKYLRQPPDNIVINKVKVKVLRYDL